MPDAARKDIRILATDIDRNMLERARQGRYGGDNAAKLPRDIADCGFDRDGDGVAAKGDLKTLVSFRELNLIGDWPMRRRFQAIFCRNVLIYFTRDLQARLFERFAGQLEPGGFLYIGHSERMHGPVARDFVQSDITTYRYLPGRGGTA